MLFDILITALQELWIVAFGIRMQLPSNSGAEATTTVRSAWGGHEPGSVTANPNLLDLQRFKRHLCNCLPRCVDDNLEGVRLLAIDGASHRRGLSVSDHHGKISPSTDIVLKGMKMKLQQGRRAARLHVAGVTVVCHTIADLTRTRHISSCLSVVVGKHALISKLELAFVVGTCEELVAVKVNDTVGQLLLLLREFHLDATHVEVCLIFHLRIFGSGVHEGVRAAHGKIKAVNSKIVR